MGSYAEPVSGWIKVFKLSPVVLGLNDPDDEPDHDSMVCPALCCLWSSIGPEFGGGRVGEALFLPHLLTEQMERSQRT